MLCMLILMKFELLNLRTNNNKIYIHMNIVHKFNYLNLLHLKTKYLIYLNYLILTNILIH